MSKQKTLKPKITGMDIMYRIVMALMAVAVPVVAFFSNLIYFVVESEVFALIAQLKGDSTDTGATENSYSIYKFIQTYGSMLSDSNNESAKNVIWSSVESIHAPIIATVAFFAVAILISVVILIVSCISSKKLPKLILSGVGLVSMICMSISFKAFANPITSGEINLSTFFGSSIISSVLPYIASVSVLVLTSAFNGMVMLFIGMIVWSGAYMVVDAGDKQKPIKIK